MEYHEPRTVEEALGLLAKTPDARCLAGGATLVAMLNAQLVEPPALVSLRRLEGLTGIDKDKSGAIVIGAMTTHHRVAASAVFDAGQTIVPKAAARIGHPAIRNMGTIGGSIAHADPAADYPAALVAAGAEIEIRGAKKGRWVAADDFFLDFFETAVEPGEMVTAVRVPKAPGGSVAAYTKLARVDGDFAIVSVALVVTMERGRCSHVRIALGGCGPTPVRTEEAEAALLGSGLEPAALAKAGKLLAEASDPVDDVRASADYRRKVIPHLVARTAAQALGREETNR